jgi:hypothetical protein
MKHAKLFLFLVAALASAASLQAGDTTYSQHGTVIRTRTHWEQSERVHGWATPFIYIGRACDTFLHAPQIFAEGIMGDRALVNHRGVLGPKEEPVEDRIISPAD